jgi:hypothetical protein
LTVFAKYARLQLITIDILWWQQETTGRDNFSDNRKRRVTMGDKGGKKDKEKSQKQDSKNQQKREKNKLDKQPRRKP